MKRPLFIFCISLICGIAAASIIKNYMLILALTVIIATVLYLLKSKFYENKILSCGMLISFILGAVLFNISHNSVSVKFSQYAGQDVIVKGYVASEADIREKKIQYVIRTEQIESQGHVKKVKGKLLLTTLIDGSPVIYEYGRCIEITGQLNLPKGQRNPGGFDYSRYLAGAGISAALFARDKDIATENYRKGNILVETGLKLRSRIVNVIDRSLPKEQAALLNGMLIGHTKGLSENVKNAFSDAGLSHLMAVSGANVAFIVLPLIFLFKRLRIRLVIANAFTIALLVLFVYITGFSPSVVRAVIMAVTVLTGQMLKRESDVFSSIAVAAILLLLQNPGMVFDIGFQLSFAATLSIVLFYSAIKSFIDTKYIPAFLKDVIAVSLAAQAGVLPITAFFFNKVSIVSIFSNILAVPLTGVITVLGFIMAMLGQISILLSQLLGHINVVMLSFILFVTKTSAALPFSVLRISTPSIALVAFYYVLLLFYLWYKPKYKPQINVRYYVLVYGAVTIIAATSFIMPKKLEVVFLDVGQLYGVNRDIRVCYKCL